MGSRSQATCSFGHQLLLDLSDEPSTNFGDNSLIFYFWIENVEWRVFLISLALCDEFNQPHTVIMYPSSLEYLAYTSSHGISKSGERFFLFPA